MKYSTDEAPKVSWSEAFCEERGLGDLYRGLQQARKEGWFNPNEPDDGWWKEFTDKWKEK